MDIIEWLLQRMGRERRGEGINPVTHAGYDVHNQAYGTPAPRATPAVGGGMSMPVMQRMVGDLMSNRAPVQMGAAQAGPSYAQRQAQQQASWAERQAQLDQRMAQISQNREPDYFSSGAERMVPQSQLDVPRRFAPPPHGRSTWPEPKSNFQSNYDRVRAKHQAQPAQQVAMSRFPTQAVVPQPQKRTGQFNAPRSIHSDTKWF